jgi:hypothetical protein
MTVSREDLDKRLPPTFESGSRSDERISPKRQVPPFDEPIYTINEAARILRLSPNQTRSIFRNEPGVHDLAAGSPASRLLSRKSQLRIPHATLVGFWKRTELCRPQDTQSMPRRSRYRRTAA